MKQLIAGNWKMHLMRHEAEQLARSLREGAGGIAAELAVFPPFTTLAAVTAMLAGSAIAVGGQDCHPEAQGAHTGDISASMLRDAGATWVILGHSERRQNHGETDELIREKALAAATAALTPIVCVGESEDQRQSGEATEVVGWQLAGSLPNGYNGVIAYEPVWAIGTGKTPSEAEIGAMHAFIRDELARQFGPSGGTFRILYGGSVKPSNARALLSIPEVNGALVGGASLNAEDFLAIARAASA